MTVINNKTSQTFLLTRKKSCMMHALINATLRGLYRIQLSRYLHIKCLLMVFFDLFNCTQSTSIPIVNTIEHLQTFEIFPL